MTGVGKVVLLIMATSFCGIGMVYLALSQRRNWNVFGSYRIKRTQTQTVGSVFLLASLATSAVRDGVSFAALIWPMLVAVQALTVGMIMAFKPRWLRPFAKIVNSDE